MNNIYSSNNIFESNPDVYIRENLGLSQKLTLPIEKYLSPNISGGLDLFIDDKQCFNNNIFELKVAMINTTNDNILVGRAYSIVIGDSCVCKGTVIDDNNIFPTQNIPLGLLTLHKVALMIHDVDAIDFKHSILNIIISEATKMFDGAYNEIIWNWPSKEITEGNHRNLKVAGAASHFTLEPTRE